MGAEESKSGNYGLMGPSAVVANMTRQAQLARSWALLHQCSLEQWKNGHGEAAGFSETTLTCNNAAFKDCTQTFCVERQGIININKSYNFFSFRRKHKFTKMAEHFEYNFIPAQVSSIQNFHIKGVVCYHDNYVVLHIVKNMTSRFAFIDIKTNKFHGIFGTQMVEFYNEVIHGAISPDNSIFLLKLPNIMPNSRGTFRLLMYNLKNLKKLQDSCLQEIPLHHSYVMFRFDPRFNCQRVAITNFVQGEDNSLSLVCLKNDSHQVLATNPRVNDMRSSQALVLKDLFYSRDGNLVFAVLAAGGCHCKEKKARRNQPIDISIYIFNGDTSQTLHCIQYHRYTCSLHSCPINYTPVFSNCGSRMAIVLNDMETDLDHVQIYKLPTAISLQNRCRIRILQAYTPEEVSHLPLPTRLIQYLHFQPEYN